MKLRRHQERAEEIGSEIHDGQRDEKIITAHVTPGGGKTLMASIFAHQLLKRDVERVLIACPRKTLQQQMRDGFTIPSLGLNECIEIGHHGTRSLLRRKQVGCVTTYQDIVGDANGSRSKWLKFVTELPTLVILDETHHLQSLEWNGAEDKEESGWTRAVAPLVAAARRVLLMTGTMSRDNKAPIAFVEYKDRLPVVNIPYTRRDALAEKAILNVSVKLCDGEATYWHRFSRHTHTLSNASAKEESRALRALLDDAEYRNKVLAEALGEMAQYRETRNPRARMIVICKDQPHSRAVFDYLKSTGGYKPVLAISDEKESHKRVALFRDRREGDVLVTCQIAYEGLDVPDCTHLVSLTNIRSTSWLEQALSRVTRFDSKCDLPWEEQCAYLYVPNDPSMVSFLSEWIDEQDPRYGDPPKPKDGEGGSRDSTFKVISGEMTETRYADTYGVFSDSDQYRLSLIDRECPYLRHLPAIQRLHAAKKMWPNDSDMPGWSKAS